METITATIYSPLELESIAKNAIPKHIAIIPDGNRRWAKNKLSSSVDGHRQGGHRLIEIVKAAKVLGISTVTFYLFSTENWNRPAGEIAALMWLLESFLDEQRQHMLEESIHFDTIGDLVPYPQNVKSVIDKTKEVTKECNSVNLIFALNYGSRDEIRRACQKIALKCKENILDIEDITENTINEHLDTAPWGDPDLWIRASGEQRLSNFLLWQLSYAELYTTPVLWPDFNAKHLLEAVQSYQQRQRRLGG